METDASGMAHTIRLEMEVPEEIVDQVFEEELLRDFREQTAIRLFKEGRASSGYAAKLIGISRLEFLRLLEQRGVPFAEYTHRDFEDDASTMQEIRGHIEINSNEPRL